MTALDPSAALVQKMDSALGSWISARWSPTADSPLYGIVERLWYFDGVLADSAERVFPDGSAELVIMLDEPHRDGDTEKLAVFPAVCINGIRTHSSVVVAPRARCRVVGVRFNPIGACRMFRQSMTDLVDVTVDFQSSLGRSAGELGERCAAAADSFAWNNARNAEAVVAVCVRWLENHAAHAIECDPAVSWTAAAIRSMRGVVSLDFLGSRLGIPRSRLSQRFCDFVGVTPKRFARIMRFHSALGLIGRGESIAGAAAELGYYDQAHLYRDFTEFAGMTPGAYMAGKRYPGGVSLAEP
jgi:AraC-like DNA-binding protein